MQGAFYLYRFALYPGINAFEGGELLAGGERIFLEVGPGQALGYKLGALKIQELRDADEWQWGKIHTVTLRNQTLGKSGIKPVEALFTLEADD